MRPRTMLSLLLSAALACSGTDPAPTETKPSFDVVCSTLPTLTPPGPSTVPTSTTSLSFWFFKNNCTSTSAGTWDFTVTRSGAVASAKATPSFLTLAAGASAKIRVDFTTGATAGTGTVTLTATRDAPSPVVTISKTQTITVTGSTPTNPLPVGVFRTYANRAIGTGPGGDATAPRWSVLWYPPQPETISQDIDLADANNVLLVLLMPRNKNQHLDPVTQKFSIQKYKDVLDEYVFGSGKHRVDQVTSDKVKAAMARRRIICYVIDEPNLDNYASPDQVEEMAAAHKARWDCLTVARITPTLLENSWGGHIRTTNYPSLDYAWSHYNNNHGRAGQAPRDVWAAERQAATRLNMGLAVALNLWAGGNYQTVGNQLACWDYANNGSSSGYIRGDRDKDETVDYQGDYITCGSLSAAPPPQRSLVASPNWIRYFAQEVANDGNIPFFIMWEEAHASIGSSTEFAQFYGRRDFELAFDDAIRIGQSAQAAPWRIAK